MDFKDFFIQLITYNFIILFKIYFAYKNYIKRNTTYSCDLNRLIVKESIFYYSNYYQVFILQKTLQYVSFYFQKYLISKYFH